MGSNSKRILLTGGAGFIGSHLADALIRRGNELSIVDNVDDFYASSRKRRNLQEIGNAGSYQFFEVDIRDRDALRKAAERATPEVIIHLAARAGVRPSIEQPALYESVNVGGTVNLLEIAREFSGSSSAHRVRCTALPTAFRFAKRTLIFAPSRLMRRPSLRRS